MADEWDIADTEEMATDDTVPTISPGTPPMTFGPSTGMIPQEEIAARVHAPDVYGSVTEPVSAPVTTPVIAPEAVVADSAPVREPDSGLPAGFEQLSGPQQAAVLKYLGREAAPAQMQAPVVPVEQQLIAEQQERQRQALMAELPAINPEVEQQMVQEGLVTPRLEDPVVEAQEREQVKQALTPSKEELEISMRTQMEPVRRQIADEAAAAQANQELDKFIATEQVRKQRLENEARALETKDAEYVRAQSFGEIMRGGTFGQKVLASLAVMLGAASQGLTGAKENPALQLIDAEADRQAVRDKLTFEQKLQLKNQLIQASQNIINASQSRFDNKNTQQKLQLEYDKLGQAMQENMLKMKKGYDTAASFNAVMESQFQNPHAIQGNPQEKVAIAAQNEVLKRSVQNVMVANPKLGQELVEKKINLPNGAITISPAKTDQVAKFNEARADIEGGKAIVDRIIAAARTGSKLDPRDRAALQSDLTALTGRLRQTYLGPGAMTQQEYDRLYAAIGDPTKIFTINAIEIAKLNAVKENLDVDLAARAKSVANVSWPVSQRTMVIAKLRASGMTPREASERADRLLEKAKKSGGPTWQMF